VRCPEAKDRATLDSYVQYLARKMGSKFKSRRDDETYYYIITKEV
jgi:hypothetical protein